MDTANKEGSPSPYYSWKEKNGETSLFSLIRGTHLIYNIVHKHEHNWHILKQTLIHTLHLLTGGFYTCHLFMFNETQSSLPAAFPFGGLKSVTSRNQTHTIIYKDNKSTYLYATLIFFLLSGSYLSGQAQRVAPSPPRWPAGDSTTPSLGSPSSSPPSISSPTVTRSSQCLALRSHPFSCTKPATNLMG